MKITTADVLRSCENLACTLNGRLEEALSVAQPEEQPVLCELAVKARELSLSLSQFSERLRSFRPEPEAGPTRPRTKPKAARRTR
jgi:hypothetical protein